ncbi:EAL domain-containing protein [Halarcobacter sp.]|uniref:EAL domain-containing protein n=1 Tax=Halarcobacter sp. TaxID=2321133 RepID=UPI002AAB9498|nr:EAL domain-containing protein [Halarcobacter sp.]
MACNKCNQKFGFENLPSKIYFISEYDELMSKSRIFLMKLGLDVYKVHDLHYIKTENTKEFFYSNIDAIKSNFNLLETEDIKLFIEYEDVGFSYKTVLNAKPMQRFLNLIDDKDFFDVINNESLTSHFQPIIEAKSDSIYGYECLIRGVNPDGSLMYPDILFKKSTRNDMNFNLDRLCRESALKTAATKKIDKKIFINFIPTTIYDPEFCLKSTVKWAKQLEFDPSNIIFEVVETEQVRDQKHLKTILEYYRNEGFKIALDDVGEGYSGLNRIIDLKPDIIKIDRNIIKEIDTNELKQSVYKALYNLSKENGIEILAEGIETAYELDAIKDIGVDYMQGYYFSKPMPEPIRKIKG